MITLTRGIGESITIGDNIKITIVGINNDSVRLTIEAPHNMSIYRSEMAEHLKLGLNKLQNKCKNNDDNNIQHVT